MAEQRCPMYWHDHDIRCVLDEHHEPPCVFRGHGALFVAARVYQDALEVIASLSQGEEGERARRTLERLKDA